jgi:cytochrome bd-type quinol oxidase subunit 1
VILLIKYSNQNRFFKAKIENIHLAGMTNLVLLTVVFGTISGVGIWFTIALIHPSATSTLIHSYVWGWAIEWVFFFLEITAALLYLYGWNKLDRRTHLWLGWVYFIAAFASMVIINGIITFMLTSGKWIENHEFWFGFFNPTYFPSLFSRFAFSLALAGIYALVTASLQKNAELKGKIVKWSARWIVPAFIVLPFFVYWYIYNISPQVWASSKGLMPMATRYANLIVIFAIATFVLSLLTLIKPRKMHFVFSLVVLAAAFTTMWAFEFIRESIRKPYIIANYMYGNSLYKTPMNGDRGFNLEQINQNGVLKTAKWVQHREITEPSQIAAGKEIFRMQCQSCHTVAAGGDNYARRCTLAFSASFIRPILLLLVGSYWLALVFGFDFPDVGVPWILYLLRFGFGAPCP